MCSPLVEPMLLQYKVLIHVDEVRDFSNAGKPWFLGSCSSSGQSGIPDADDGFDGGGGVSVSRRSWQFEVPDGRRVSGGGDQRNMQQGGPLALPLLKLPPMGPHVAILGSGPALPVRERLTSRVSDVDRLTGLDAVAKPCSNLMRANCPPPRPPIYPP
ncbi:hypothetical protein D1007_00842 [Hordeum vulgare]|nr:hypothetical protein D1007_00842 [Hordeum vulgare]